MPVSILEEVLVQVGKSVSDITKIYHGKDHACRCGCSGNYFDNGEVGYKRAINKLSKPSFNSGEIDIGYNYINIPEDYTDDKCYCLYFD